jgi:hypothetical protein
MLQRHGYQRDAHRATIGGHERVVLDFGSLSPAIPTAMPDWSPVRSFGGYQERASRSMGKKYAALAAASCGCGSTCGVHGHQHASSWAADAPVSDRATFWGGFGCSCWAV